MFKKSILAVLISSSLLLSACGGNNLDKKFDSPIDKNKASSTQNSTSSSAYNQEETIKNLDGKGLEVQSIYSIDGVDAFNMVVVKEKADTQNNTLKIFVSKNGENFLPALINLKTGENILDKFISKNITDGDKKSSNDMISKIMNNELDKSQVFVEKKGNGERKLFVITDPDCPFCKKLEQETLENLDNVEITYLYYPILSLHPDALNKTNKLWDEDNAKRVENYKKFIATGELPKNGKEKSSYNFDYAENISKGVALTGTPFLVNPKTGDVLVGAVKLDKLNEFLDNDGSKTTEKFQLLYKKP